MTRFFHYYTFQIYKLQECFEEGGQFDIDFLILDKDLLHHYQGRESFIV